MAKLETLKGTSWFFPQRHTGISASAARQDRNSTTERRLPGLISGWRVLLERMALLVRPDGSPPFISE